MRFQALCQPSHPLGCTDSLLSHSHTSRPLSANHGSVYGFGPRNDVAIPFFRNLAGQPQRCVCAGLQEAAPKKGGVAEQPPLSSNQPTPAAAAAAAETAAAAAAATTVAAASKELQSFLFGSGELHQEGTSRADGSANSSHCSSWLSLLELAFITQAPAPGNRAPGSGQHGGKPPGV